MAGTIHTRTAFLTSEFLHLFGLELWNKYPAEQVTDLEEDVAGRDAFKSRLISLSGLFEAFNKKGFDRSLGFKNEGARLSLVAFLKTQLPNHHPQIDDVFRTVSMVSLLRAYIVHSKNQNYKEAFQFFKIPEPLTDYAMAWASLKLHFELFLADFVALIANKNAVPIKQVELESSSIETALRYTLQKHAYDLRETPLAKMMLKEIAVRGEILDTDLAKAVGHPVELVRQILLPFTSSFIRVKYATNSSTLITMPEFRDQIKNLEDWLEDKK